MNKRERVMTAVKGGVADKVPCAFWYHFPHDCAYGEKAVQVHLEFFRESGTDICKVMNENSCPHNLQLQTAADWSNLQPFTMQEAFIKHQVELVKEVVERMNGETVVLATVHGLVASAFHMLGGVDLYDQDGLALTRHLRENPQGIHHAFAIITDYLKKLCRACLDAGADGIYFASLGGERRMFTDEEFATFIRPYEVEVLESIQDVPCFNILHMCKNNLNLARYLGYPCEVLNWGVFEDNISLNEGRKLFGAHKVYLGGLDDRAGVIVDGTLEEIADTVRDIIHGFGAQKFILGADCTLPTDLPSERLRAAADAARL